MDAALKDSPFTARLANARKDLLDLGCRNRLISTQRGSGRTSRLEVVDELSAEVFRRLVTEQKSMSFLPVEEPDETQETLSIDESNELVLAQPLDEDGESKFADRRTDEHLQTSLTSESLQKRLLKLHADARVYEEEQGVNILFLALGFLKWYEDERSTVERYAPLILVPVTLTRRSANSRFKIAWTQDDLSTNLSLQEKLRHEFGVKLPDLPPHEELDPNAYFTSVAAAVSAAPRWEVDRNGIVLWFYSFSKFLMYRDLDPKVWPADRPIHSNPLVEPLLGDGFRDDPPICPADSDVDAVLSPADTFHVVDADSSQAIAIEEVRRGKNLVIQGPPGTGKSQTIANIIAAAVKDGKRVLFVAEKMAALEVVKRRLDKIDLGEMCLELHSHKANKRAILEDLKRTKALRDFEPRLDGVRSQADKLRECRDALNRHAKVIHTLLQPSGVSAFRAIAELVGLRATLATAPKCKLPHALEWSLDDFHRKVDGVRDLAKHIERLGSPIEHPWRGVLAKGVLPSDVSGLVEKIPAIRQSIQQLRMCAEGLSRQLGVPIPRSAQQLADTARSAQAIAGSPPMDRGALNDPAWDDARDAIDALIERGRELDAVRKKLDGVVAEAGWQTEVATYRRDLKACGNSWFRMFYKSYREAYAGLAGILVAKPPKSLVERVQLLDDLMLGQKASAAIDKDDDGDKLGRRAFGTEWRGADSKWEALAAVGKWEHECRTEKHLPADFRRMAAAVTRIKELVGVLAVAKQTLKPTLQKFTDAVAPFKLDMQSAVGSASILSASLDAIDQRLEAWIAHPESLSLWIAYLARAEQLESEKLLELARMLDKGDLHYSAAVPELSAAFYESLLREAFRIYPDLTSFDGLSHEQIVEKFRTLDKERLKLARQEVAHAHHRRIPQGDAGEMAVINREMNKKRSHLPIRRLLKDAGHAVQSLKPVFMMSPISVAQFLEPGILEFDLLLIDEASQVEPVDAFGAMFRARQVAVVGDDRQLPPTQFFSKMLGDDQQPESEDNPQTADIESVLGLCRAKGMRDEMLR